MAKKKITQTYESVDWRALAKGTIIGVDEVGRGCLAGPVYSAAVILQSDEACEGLTDSKLLSPMRRKEISTLILRHHLVGIGIATVEEIDELNILQASLLSMKRAVSALEVSSGLVLVDGNQKIPHLSVFKQQTFIKGDLRVAPISAASIVAKVARDEWMQQMAEDFPHYGFQDHKGYATQVHKEAIKRLGPCQWHRKSFRGVKEYIAGART